MKYISSLIASTLIIFSSLGANTVQIIPRSPSFGEEFGRGLGNGMGLGLQQSLQHNFYNRKDNSQEKKDAKLLKKLINDYHPSRHSEYVLQILESPISNNLKGFTISVLNQIHAEYTLQNEKNLKRKSK